MATLVKKIISTAKCPKALAPYSQAVIADRTIYCSGMLGLELPQMQLIPGGAGPQSKLALQHIINLLDACDSRIENVVKTTIFLADMNDYGVVNDEYKKIFSSNFPARSCFQVAKLPMGAAVEIEIIALTGDVKTVSA
uniref:Putative translation initiation inhibitor n=1 Tax=Corethrella appendiculata TaxID=1370023 RepID=U5EWE7_9DIPT